MNYRLSCLFLLSLATQAFADAPVGRMPQKPTPSIEYSINAGFIYWQPIEKDLEVAQAIISGTPPNYTYEEITAPFRFMPGFKVGLGLSTSEIESEIEYTRLKNSVEKVCSDADSSVIYSPYWTFSGTFSQIDYEWLLDYNMISWSVASKMVKKGAWSLLPYFQVKGGTIFQKLTQDGVPVGYSFLVENTYRCNSWLLGAGGGIKNQIELGAGFAFLFSTDMNLLYEEYRTHVKNEWVLTPDNVSRNQETLRLINPNIDVSLAFDWKSPVCKNKFSTHIGVGYDFLFYANQNTLKKIRAILYGADAGDLMLQGLTVKASLNW